MESDGPGSNDVLAPPWVAGGESDPLACLQNLQEALDSDDRLARRKALVSALRHVLLLEYEIRKVQYSLRRLHRFGYWAVAAVIATSGAVTWVLNTWDTWRSIHG